MLPNLESAARACRCAASLPTSSPRKRARSVCLLLCRCRLLCCRLGLYFPHASASPQQPSFPFAFLLFHARFFPAAFGASCDWHNLLTRPSFRYRVSPFPRPSVQLPSSFHQRRPPRGAICTYNYWKYSQKRTENTNQGGSRASGIYTGADRRNARARSAFYEKR